MKKNKINKLILLFIPSNICNLKCEYCFVSQVHDWERKDIGFKYSVEHIIKALSQKRLGGECFINLTSQGETLLYKDIVKLTYGLLEEGHSVEIITNCLISNRLNELLSLPESLLKNLFFKCSYHYNQIKNKTLEKIYWDNINKIKNSPCSFTVELMPHDEIIDEIPKICESCKKNVGALCHATVGRDDTDINKGLLTSLPKEEYTKTWSVLKSPMFDLKMDLYGQKRKEFCYAGAWSLLVDISSGEASQCYGRPNTQNIFKNLKKPIKFRPVGHSCKQPFCFNGHAHIAWGIIPEYKSPTYFEVRNRKCSDGTNWVKGGCEELFKQKLIDNNKEYTKKQKVYNTITNPFYLFRSLFHDINGTIRKTKKYVRIKMHKFKK